jgi:sugar lactone lactonase YvrE
VIEVFDFNPATGIVSNAISLPMAAPNNGYGVCFSPDNSKFYITEAMPSSTTYQIYQYDLSSGNAATIIASRKFLGDVANRNYRVADMQIAPDNKIYFAEP